MKRVLVLGAGLVSAPLVRYLLERSGARVLVAAINVERARQLVGDHPRGHAAYLDVGSAAALAACVAEADLVISLLPQSHHVAVARHAIASRVPLVTTSYVSEGMRALDGEARRAGVLLLNEIGLDPGIDHMSAMRVIDGIRGAGGEIVAFSSCCGGLPAPDANDNPWGYKFSWSPRGVLLAGQNAARWLRHGEEVEVPGARLFSCCWPIEVSGLGRFEVYPNRDALAYRAAYGIERIESIFRGTIRYPGWCETLRAVGRLGLLDATERTWPRGATFADLTARTLPRGAEPIARRIARHLALDDAHPVLGRLAWAGLLEKAPLPRERAAPLDLLCERLQEKMAYAPGERDMILLRHEIVAHRASGARERVVAELLAFGESAGDSAMARTVALPAAIAARRILEGKVALRGVAIPVDREIYEPVLAEIEELGIAVRERTLPDEHED